MTLSLDAALRAAREAEEIAAKATPGPWKRDRNWWLSGPGHYWPETPKQNGLDQLICQFNGPRSCGSVNSPEADQDWTIHARTREPYLARAVQSLADEVERLRALLASKENVPQIVIDDALAACRALIGEGIYNSHTAPDAARRVLEWNDACPRSDSAALSTRRQG